MKTLRDDHVEITSLQALEEYVRGLVAQLGRKAIVLLSGPLGAGKTKTVEFLVRQKGVAEVASPTFALHHRYTTPDLTIEHFDLYRIEGETDLESIGFWDTFQNREGWVIVEWPERIERRHLPQDWPTADIRIEFKNENAESSRVYHTRIDA